MRAQAALLAGVVAAIYLLWQPPSADLAAALYRAHLGLATFDLSWYGGQHPLAYSSLMPVLSAVGGVRLLAAVSAVAGATLFACLVRSRRAALWFACVLALSLFSGRVTFTLGVAIALAAAFAAERRRLALACALAALSTLASPVAGAFLALVLLLRRTRVALAALLPLLALAVLYPEPGYFPFAASSFWPALAATIALAALVREHRPTLALYALALSGSFVLHTAVGGNAARLGALLAGPLALRYVADRRALALLLPLFGYWALQAPVRDVVRASGDPSIEASYYAPMIGFLRSRPGPFRIEIPFTASHWESYRVAPGFALARGWERQLDIGLNHVFYTGAINSVDYARWLREHAVSYVALPDARLDYSAWGEAALIRAGQSFLKPLWSSAHWHVYAVAGPAPLASSPARMTAMSSGGFTLAFQRAGLSEVRIRYAGGGCTSPTPGGWTSVRASGAQRLRISFNLLGARCERLDDRSAAR